MSIVWEEGPGRHASGMESRGSDVNGRVGTVSLLALFAVAAATLAAAAWWPDGGQAPQAAEAALAQPSPPEPVAPTAARLAAEPSAPAEQPLPEGSARFALDAPAPAIIAKNWRPAGTAASSIDTAATASIAAGDVPVAETEADVVAMETKLAAAGSGQFEVPAAPDMVAGRTLKWVNMRSGPGNESEVLTVVPYDAAIRVQKDCPHWCAVTYDGQDGYIYNSFIEYGL